MGAAAVPTFRAVAALLVALLATAEARAGDGCAPGTFSVVTAPDARAASVLFDDFSVQAEGGAGSTPEVSRRCDLSVPVDANADRVALHGADYRGFTQLAIGQSSSLVVTHGQGVDVEITSGPADGDTRFRQLLASDASGFLRAEVLLSVQPQGSLEPAIAVLDSIDLGEVAFTSRSSVRHSVDVLARQRLAALTHLATSADVLLGTGQRLDDPSGVAALAATGSSTLGARAHWRGDSGVSVLAGIGRVRLSPGNVGVDAPTVLALAVRYVDQGARLLRPFFETGLWGVRDLQLRADRAYLNGSSARHDDGSTIGAYVRAGALHASGDRGELAVALTLSRDWLRLDGNAETFAMTGNPFPLALAGRTTSPYAAKAGLTWSGTLSDRLDYTLALAGGRTFADDAALSGNVAWIGKVTSRPKDSDFIEYAARVGWRHGAVTTLDVFVLGTRGSRIGADTQVGIGLRRWL